MTLAELKQRRDERAAALRTLQEDKLPELSAALAKVKMQRADLLAEIYNARLEIAEIDRQVKSEAHHATAKS